ncbi:MAG TPA: PAS domain-containing sensor histidine kinase [Allosphingosinicella sp.]|nr:PAS domain-containing sensor histidine kinase [Allosphingosinicella sp.]
MASRVAEPRDLPALVSAAGWRLLLAAVLVGGFVTLAAAQRYASALIAASALALTLFDLWRLSPRRRSAAIAEPPPLALARRLDEALALIDAVTVALFVVDEDKRVRFANRAGRALAGFDLGRLEDIKGLGGDAAAAILALPPGGRQLLTLGDGRTFLVWVGSIAMPGTGARRLVSMQAVAGELDAVQVGAWHMMTRVLAHEMMNSLTPIASLSESIARLTGGPGDDPRVAGAVATIKRRSEHLIGFVERYRAVVDLPAPRLEPVDLAAFLAAMEGLVGADLRRRGIDFAATPGPGREAVQADPALLEQAVLNLVKNAAEAVAGRPGARVRLSSGLASGSATLTVSDNGPGIEEDRAEEVFVPFYTTKEGGGGIGLTLARQIALAHGGRLTVKRLAAGGTAFEIRLPDV